MQSKEIRWELNYEEMDFDNSSMGRWHSRNRLTSWCLSTGSDVLAIGRAVAREIAGEVMT